MPNAIVWRVLPLVIMISLIVAACSDLAGDVQIVETLPPASDNSQVVQNVSDVTLPDMPPNIANGEIIFQQSCTSCHGATGEGDGALVESGDVPRMGSFQDPIHMRQQSVEFYYDIITNGNIINLMPPWSGSLSLQERWDVLMYVYTLQYNETLIAQGANLIDNPSSEIRLESDSELAANTGLTGEDAFAAVAYERMQAVRSTAIVDTPQATEDLSNDVPEITLEAVNFSGTLSQGSPNASLPSGVTVQLQYGDFIDVSQVVDAVVDANGQFSLSDIPVLSNSTYFAVAFYDGRAFVSDPILTRDLQENNTVDITLYETTEVAESVSISRMELVFDHLTVPDLGAGIVTNQISLYNNPTDYVFHVQPPNQAVRISLLVYLPVGSILLDDTQQSDFISVPDQFALIDTRPVYPGEHIVESNYFIPYENDAQTIDIFINNRFEGELSIVVIDPELQIISDTFLYSDDINIGTDEAPILAKVYSGMVSLAAGSNIIFDIEGQIASNTSSDTSVVTQDQLLPILLAVVFVVVLIGLGIGFFLRGNRNNPQAEIDRIITEISRLEQMHDAGQINHDAFQQKRTDLKARLAELMTESSAE